jgi:hypothetical protein
MEFNKQKLVLSKKEAGDLVDVFNITSQIGPNSTRRSYPRPLSEEEKTEARRVKNIVAVAYRSTPTDEAEVSADHFTDIRTVAELALSNSQDVVRALCTPDVCSGYRSEWRPAAFRVLAMTAEISEGIALQQQ